MNLLHSRCKAEIAYLREELSKAQAALRGMIDPMLEARQASALRLKAVAEAEMVKAKDGTTGPAKKSAVLPHSAAAVARLRGLAVDAGTPLAAKSPEEVEAMFEQKAEAG